MRQRRLETLLQYATALNKTHSYRFETALTHLLQTASRALAIMYEYRQADENTQKSLLSNRRLAGLPLHEPQHREFESGTYLITAANFEHQPIMASQERRLEWEKKLLDLLISIENAEVLAWCVLPNHYHLLAKLDLMAFEKKIGRLNNGIATQWNKENLSPGRRVWFRFSDRGIRNERHLFVALNYIHANPVKHGYVRRAQEWPTSSLPLYEQKYGIETLREYWKQFPVRDFGKGWDW